jgi:hypothetical protein
MPMLAVRAFDAQAVLTLRGFGNLGFCGRGSIVGARGGVCPKTATSHAGPESIVRAHDPVPDRIGGVTLLDLVGMTAEGAVFSEIGAAGNSCRFRGAPSR